MHYGLTDPEIKTALERGRQLRAVAFGDALQGIAQAGRTLTTAAGKALAHLMGARAKA